MIYVYTSILDGFDNLRPPAAPPDEDVRYICFTNIPNLPRVYPWEYRPAYIVGEACRSARLPKILPHLMLPEDAEYSIYHDGNFQLRLDPHQLIGELLASEDWAVHKHPARGCIYDEAALLLKEKIGTGALIESEVRRYRAAGYPDGAGLWANGLIVRRHTDAVARVNERWWNLYAAGCERDQLSFPVARREFNFPLRTINQDIWSSDYLLFHWHAAWKSKSGNEDFWPGRDVQRRRLAEIARVTGWTGGVRYPEY